MDSRSKSLSASLGRVTFFIFCSVFENNFFLSLVILRGKVSDTRVLNSELRKLSAEEKKELARKLLIEASNEDNDFNHNIELQNSYQDSEFENPFNTSPPTMLKSLDIDDELSRNPSLRPNEFTALKLHSVKPLGETLAEYTFSLPQATDFTGCFPGQYVLVRIGKHQRFLSPVSRAKELGTISLLLKHETNGIFSNCIRALQIGENNITKYLEVKCKPIL